MVEATERTSWYIIIRISWFSFLVQRGITSACDKDKYNELPVGSL